MNARMLLRRAALAAALALAIAAPAHATCTYVPLSSATPAVASSTPTFYQFTQGSIYWSAVGVRPASGDDWDIVVYGSTAADPVCLTNGLASSSGTSGIDFVIGDFNHNALGTFYPDIYRFSGTQPASVEWDDGPDAIAVNGAAIAGQMNGGDVLRVWDVSLTAGVTYTFDFFPQGFANAHLLLFRNAGGGTYWSGRSGAAFDVTGSTTFTAPTSGYYGVVVTNEAGYAFNFTLGVTASACGIPQVLSTYTPTLVAPPGNPVAYEVEIPYWTGCAVRPTSGDWDLTGFGAPSGSASPTCLANALASSALSGGSVDFVVADFNHTPHGWQFALPSIFSGGANGAVEALGSLGALGVNGEPVTPSIAAATLADCWDVYLDAGHTYALTFSPPAGLTLCLMANVGGGAYYGGRTSAALVTTSSTTYTAPVSGWYGLVVANDGAVAGIYTLGVGDCSLVTPLVSGVATSTGPTRNAYFEISPNGGYWNVVGVRNTTADWDVVVSADSVASPAPACATMLLATSSYVEPTQDFVVGAGISSPARRYVRMHQFTPGPPNPGTVEWNDSAEWLNVNDNNATVVTTGASNFVTCWNVYLYAGQAYDFELTHGGGAKLKMLLFRDVPGGVYWAGRSAAEFEVTASQTYTPATTDVYGLVVVNDDGGADTYQVSLRACLPPWAMDHLPNVCDLPGLGSTMMSINPSTPYWTAVATRSDWPGEDFDLYVYSQPTGGPVGTCFSGLLAYSDYGSGYTDFVVGDFNYNTYGTYYVEPVRYLGTSGGEAGWFPGSQSLGLGAAPSVVASYLPFNMVTCWDANLTAGQTYTIQFSHAPGLDAKVDVFAPTGAAYWGGRSAALLEAQHSVTFTAPVSGWYGVVGVVDGGTGPYDIALRSGTVAVDDGTPRPARDALTGVAPNPGRAGLHIDFALHDGGEPAFEVLDMAGRRLATFAPGTRGSGTWSIGWRATDDAGRPLPAGLYFVRMRLGERVVGSRKLTLLN